MSKTTGNELSPQAIEVIKMINELAADLMLKAYDAFTPGMKMRAAKVTKCTQDMLKGDGPID